MPAGPDPHFVSRERELAALHAALDRVRHGEPQLVLVNGPEGIGKTALVRRFLGQARRSRVLKASGDENEAALPYGVLEQLLSCSLDGSEPLAVGSAVLGHLGHLQTAGPVILVIDDAQWADRLSMQALTFVFRRLRVDRVFAIVVTRDPDDPRLPEGMRRVLHDGLTLRLTVGPLDAGELGLLCGRLGVAPLSSSAVERLRVHTGGNPLHARTLLEEVPAKALNNMDTALPAPRSYALLVLGRLAGCAEQARRLVEAASVLGMSCPVHTASALAGVTEPLPALEQAVAAGLLFEEQGVGGLLVRFPHPLTRASIYQNLGPARRARLHLGAANLPDNEFHRLRHRVRAAAGPDPRLAAELAGWARLQAAEGHWHASAEHLLQAAYLSDDLVDRGRLMAEAVGVLLLDGRVDEARGVLARLPAAAEPAVRAYAMGHLAAVSGHLAQARNLLTVAWEGLDHHVVPVIARRTARQLAVLDLMRARGGDAAAWAQRALRMATERPVSDFTVFTRLTGLCVSGAAGEALSLTRALPDPSLASPYELDALLGRGLLRTFTDDLPGALGDLRGVVMACRDRSIPFRILATAMLGQAEYRAGEWDDALVHTETAASLADDAEQFWIAPICHALAALVPASRGDRAHAEGHLRAAESRPAQSQSVAARVHTAYARALLSTGDADHTATVSALEPLFELGVHDIVHEPGIVPWHDLLVDALTALGERERAQATLDRRREAAEECGRHSVLAAVERNLGNLRAARHETRAAEEAFLDGLEHTAHVDAPFVRAVLLLHFGAFLRRSGRRSAAADRLRSARDDLVRLRAQPYLHRCDRELAACGYPVRDRRGLDPGDLTPQEHAVAQLVIRGMTNRQVAGELVVSIKTVEYHLGNIYAKTGVTSRTGLTAKLAAVRP
ncbi:AAA family ATPase [Streptosporangium sp. NPDC000396]|uniref:helix-turn-helix transcriptional regulator n=1 Tax=Streptosporangium sp. NPDC000396 TaxID=3366185 RepID=UPI00369C0EF2